MIERWVVKELLASSRSKRWYAHDSKLGYSSECTTKQEAEKWCRERNRDERDRERDNG